MSNLCRPCTGPRDERHVEDQLLDTGMLRIVVVVLAVTVFVYALHLCHEAVQLFLDMPALHELANTKACQRLTLGRQLTEMCKDAILYSQLPSWLAVPRYLLAHIWRDELVPLYELVKSYLTWEVVVLGSSGPLWLAIQYGRTWLLHRATGVAASAASVAIPAHSKHV